MKKPSLELGNKLFLLLLLATILSGCSPQRINFGHVSNKTVGIARKIERAGEIHTSATGIEGKRSKVYKNFLQFTKVATTDELVALMLHRSPAVRGYAFWALAKRDYQKLDEIILEYANDQQPVFFLQGCIGGEYTLSDLMSMIVSP
ncbi:MAG: hypothetical protein AAFO03_29160, partial [Bacteroidota bacterium]